MRISDWSSDVCSSDLPRIVGGQRAEGYGRPGVGQRDHPLRQFKDGDLVRIAEIDRADHRGGRRHQPDQSLNEVVDIAEGSRLRAVAVDREGQVLQPLHAEIRDDPSVVLVHPRPRSEEHTSELQSLMRISYAVFCLKKKTQRQTFTATTLT